MRVRFPSLKLPDYHFHHVQIIQITRLLSHLLFRQLIASRNSEFVVFTEVVLPLRRFIDLLTIRDTLRLVFAHLEVLDDTGVALSHRCLTAESVAICCLSTQPLLDFLLHQSLLSDSVFDSLGCSEISSIF